MGTALVTGATGGIGQAVALALLGAGRAVIAQGRDADRLAALARAGARPLALDLADPAALDAAELGEVDVLVANAGMMPPLGAFAEMDFADARHAVEVNVTAQMALAAKVLPGMIERGRGHLIFTGSTAGHAPFAGMAVYCATKAALGAFAQALRLDLAPHGIKVTELVCGRVETGLYKDILSEKARAAMYAGGTAVQPETVAELALAALSLPPEANVSRLDILPARMGAAPGKKA